MPDTTFIKAPWTCGGCRVGKADLRPSGGNRAERFIRASSVNAFELLRISSDVLCRVMFPGRSLRDSGRMSMAPIFRIVRLKPDTTSTGPPEAEHYEYRSA
jgi:hypothetical protein